jgi:alpha-glucuronidase
MKPEKKMRALVIVAMVAGLGRAESGYDGWLRYAAVNGAGVGLPAAVTVDGAPTVVMESARNELIRGVRGMAGRTLRIERVPKEGAIVLRVAPELGVDGYSLTSAGSNLVIAGGNDRGVLYGVFALLRRIGTGEAVAKLNEKQAPRVAARWVNQWDNLDGTIERGYGITGACWRHSGSTHARSTT